MDLPSLVVARAVEEGTRKTCSSEGIQTAPYVPTTFSIHVCYSPPYN